MKQTNNFRRQIKIIGAGFFLTACGGLAAPDPNVNLPPKQNTNLRAISPSPTATVAPTPATIEEFPVATPTPTAEIAPANANPVVNSPTNLNFNSANGAASVSVDKLIIPVAGVKPKDLRDTFNDARSEGRVHDAIDIMAAGGTPVLAAADGEIARFFDSEKGGITIYQFSRDRKLMYYYAHLQARADQLQEHEFIRQGATIGYVGDTGNAGAGNFHLHFAIWIINDPKRYWDGTNINPYNFLK